MSNISNYFRAKILDNFIEETVYLGLFLNDLTENNIGIEVMPNTGYKRMPILFTLDENNQRVSNYEEITFDIATESYGEITHYGIFDKEEGGNMLIYGELDEKITINKGGQLAVHKGNITVNIL